MGSCQDSRLPDLVLDKAASRNVSLFQDLAASPHLPTTEDPGQPAPSHSHPSAAVLPLLLSKLCFLDLPAPPQPLTSLTPPKPPHPPAPPQLHPQPLLRPGYWEAPTGRLEVHPSPRPPQWPQLTAGLSHRVSISESMAFKQSHTHDRKATTGPVLHSPAAGSSSAHPRLPYVSHFSWVGSLPQQ